MKSVWSKWKITHIERIPYKSDKKSRKVSGTTRKIQMILVPLKSNTKNSSVSEVINDIYFYYNLKIKSMNNLSIFRK